MDNVLYVSGYRKCKWWLAVEWNTGRTIGELKSLTTGAASYADGRLYVLDERATVAFWSLASRA